MLNRKSRSVRSMLALAGLAACASTLLAQSQASDAPAAPSSAAPEALSPANQLDRAAALLGDGKVVAARRLLVDLTTGSSMDMLSDAQRTRALSLASNASRRLNAMPKVDVSLQTAQEAVERGDLAVALAQAQAVITAPDATNAQVQLAKAAHEAATQQQALAAKDVPAWLDQALSEVAAGNPAGARVALDRISRTGVALSEADQARFDLAQARVLDEAPIANASMMRASMQPGVIRRRPEPVEPAQPPAADPAPAMDPVIEPVTEPVAQVAQAQPVAASPSDPIAAARQWQAQELLAEADFAFNQGRFNEAVAKYGQLLSQFSDQLAPEAQAQARQRLSDAQVRIGADAVQGQDVLSNVVGSLQVQRQAAEAEFSNDLAQAEAALSRGDTQRARDLAAQARVRVGAARQAFTNEEVENFGRRVDELVGRIDRAEESVRAALQQQQQSEQQAAAESARVSQARDKARKLNESIDRVRALQQEQKYGEALQVVESQILFLDPTNPTGLLLRDVLADAILWQQYYSVNREVSASVARQNVENARAMIAPDDILTYPSDWPAISDRRGTPVAFAEAEENRRTLQVLQTRRLPVKFEETPLEGALDFVRTVTQVNMDVDWASLENEGIDRNTAVSLNLTNVSVETILNRIMEKLGGDSQSGAAWSINDGVISVASKQVINRQRTLAIYDIRDLIVEVPDYADAPTLDLQQALQASGQGGGGGGQSPFRGEGEEEPERRTLEERTNEILEIITGNVDPDGWRDNGGETGFIQQLGGLLIITNTPANHRSIHGLLTKLREYRALQVNVEARFLLVSQDFFEQVGVDLDIYLNAENNVVTQARGTRPTTRASDFFNPTTGNFSPTFPTTGPGANATRTPLPSALSPIGAPQNSVGLSEFLASSNFAQDILPQGPAMSLAGQFLDDIQVDFLIKATQADRRTVSLTAPRVTFTNGQISNIYVVTQQNIVSDLTPVTSDSAVGFDPQPTAIAEGVSMLVDGTVSADRRYVTMNIQTGVARIDDIENLPVSAVAGGQLVNSQAAQSFIQLPTVTITRVQTTVTVPDQGTILLGGQRLVTDQQVETGVPVLSKIPVLGRLFSNRVETREEQTLLILLKPTILIQQEVENRAFPGLADSLRFGTGG